MNENDMFRIGAGADAAKIVEHIRESVRLKTERGVYSDPRIARAERSNLLNLRDQDGFLEFYLECLREGIHVDINDFEIVERRKRLGSALVMLKRLIWNMLKFYTYRLWSQQNEVNGLLLSSVEAVDQRASDRIRDLERRVAALEKASARK
jgi:hypothetical protein